MEWKEEGWKEGENIPDVLRPKNSRDTIIETPIKTISPKTPHATNLLIRLHS
jgi:hypothetical protein